MAHLIRLGIVGSESTHAEVFSRLANGDEKTLPLFEGVRVVALWGEPGKEERTRQVAEKCRIPRIVSSPEEMLGEVDAVMVVLRRGSQHRQYAAPFLKAGLAVYVDKPFAATVSDCRAMIALARQHGARLATFSTIRFDEEVQRLRKELPEVGTLLTGFIAGKADPSSEYDGLLFYGIHKAELLAELFGTEVTEVRAAETPGRITAVCRFSSGLMVTVAFLRDAGYQWVVAVVGSQASRTCTPGATASYIPAFGKFLEMVKTGTPILSEEQMVTPVRVIDAVVRSLRTKKPVRLR